MKVENARRVLEDEVSSDMLEESELHRRAVIRAEEQGIVFLDEVDKLANASDIASTSGSGGRGSTLKGEGVQKELLALVEGTVVNTEYGDVKTDHVLFIGAGAFHVSKPTDLLPELQGRLPIRVELDALTKKDFIKILTLTYANLLEQQKRLMKTENINIVFTEDGIEQIAEVATRANHAMENIGARRLQSVLATVMDDISFKGPLLSNTTQTIDKAYVSQRVDTMVRKTDLARYVL